MVMAHLGKISLPLLVRLPSGDVVEVGDASFGIAMEATRDGTVRVTVDPTPSAEIAGQALPTCGDCGHLQHSLYLIYGRDARAPSTPCPEEGCTCTG
ncbi:MAG: hypothetical protein DI570_25650 [Phenylobacterium zucineum]|nr:MAG: hypothetical protein DI570_25650 [Phenylobacterium zucineum]